MKKKSGQKIKITYKRVGLDDADVQRRLEAAFNVLFEEIFTLAPEDTNLRPTEDSEVLIHSRPSKLGVFETGY